MRSSQPIVLDRITKSIEMPPELAEWVEGEAKRRDIAQAALLREAITMYRTWLARGEKFAPDIRAFETFVEMMGFCPQCEADVKNYCEQNHLSHTWLIRKAINGLFRWFPHAEGCPGKEK